MISSSSPSIYIEQRKKLKYFALLSTRYTDYYLAMFNVHLPASIDLRWDNFVHSTLTGSQNVGNTKRDETINLEAN